MAHCHNGFLNNSIWCNKGQFLPLTFWVWISSSLLVLSQRDMEQGKMLGWQLKETPQPPLHSMTFTNGYSLLSHNGSNMPRALLNRTKMQAQVIRGKSIVQCRIISSRAEELRALSFSCTRSYCLCINSCRIVSSVHSRGSLGLTGRSCDKARWARIHLPHWVALMGRLLNCNTGAPASLTWQNSNWGTKQLKAAFSNRPNFTRSPMQYD